MPQIIVSGQSIINETPDDSTIEVDGSGVPTGLVTKADGSSYRIGDLHSYAGPIELHQNVIVPDGNPSARSYLVWNGSTVETGPDYATYQAQLVAKAKAAAASSAATKIAAGITIVSTGTPALDGTYAIDTDAKSVIDGIYSGIKNGDGLPGGGVSFAFRDMAGAAHSFDETSFVNFAKATRDYLYAISQGEAPSLPVTIA